MDRVATAHVGGGSVRGNGLEGASNGAGGDVSAAEVVLFTYTVTDMSAEIAGV